MILFFLSECLFFGFSPKFNFKDKIKKNTVLLPMIVLKLKCIKILLKAQSKNYKTFQIM